jgi:hypothetical protein
MRPGDLIKISGEAVPDTEMTVAVIEVSETEVYVLSVALALMEHSCRFRLSEIKAEVVMEAHRAVPHETGFPAGVVVKTTRAYKGGEYEGLTVCGIDGMLVIRAGADYVTGSFYHFKAINQRGAEQKINEACGG